jgi:hypothetical protein
MFITTISSENKNVLIKTIFKKLLNKRLIILNKMKKIAEEDFKQKNRNVQQINIYIQFCFLFWLKPRTYNCEYTDMT